MAGTPSGFDVYEYLLSFTIPLVTGSGHMRTLYAHWRIILSATREDSGPSHTLPSRPQENFVLPLKGLSRDEAYIVPDFELAEELIARGADSAHIAISPHYS